MSAIYYNLILAGVQLMQIIVYQISYSNCTKIIEVDEENEEFNDTITNWEDLNHHLSNISIEMQELKYSNNYNSSSFTIDENSENSNDNKYIDIRNSKSLPIIINDIDNFNNI